MMIFKRELDFIAERYMAEQLAEYKEKINKIRKLAKNLKHGEDCFKSRCYKDEMECRCSLIELRKLLEE